MTAQVRREDVPAQAQRGNHRQKYLPAPAESMQQHERRPMGRAFGIVQANFTAVEAALDEAWKDFTHNYFTGSLRPQRSPHLSLVASTSKNVF